MFHMLTTIPQRRYSAQCRIILICNSPSKIIEPVRSRCLSIRIPAPSHDDIVQLLMQVAKRESCQCPFELAMKVSLHSDRNVRRAVMMLEAARVQVAPSSQMLASQPVQVPDWEIYITKLAREIMAEQTPSKLLQAREMLYELLVNCIPGDVIMTTLVNELMKAMDDSLKHEVAHWAAYYEHRLCQGSKDIFHLEAFVAKFMAVYKKWLISLFG
jgi:replication factor C subunit 3/5